MSVAWKAWLAVAAVAALGLMATPAQAETFKFAAGYDVLDSGDTCVSSCQLGRGGTGAGQFDAPVGMAASGDRVFVAEAFNNRVSVYDAASRAFARAIGANVGGTGIGTCTTTCFAGLNLAKGLSAPGAVVVAGDELFVTDGFRRRVAVFNATSGAFVRALGPDVGGAGVNVCTESCSSFAASPLGSGAGQLKSLSGVAVASNELYILDTDNARVAVYNATSGAFLRAFGKNVGGAGIDTCTATCFAGLAGTGAGQLNAPTGLAVNGAEVFVLDRGNNRVAVWNIVGNFQRAFGKNVGGAGVDTCVASCAAGTPSDAAGGLSVPTALTASGGQLFVTDAANFRVAVYNADGTFVRALGTDVGGSGINVCSGICQAGTQDPDGLTLLSSVAVAGGLVWVGEVGVTFAFQQRLRAIDATTGAFVKAFGKSVQRGSNGEAEVCQAVCDAGRSGTAAGHLAQPQGVAASGTDAFVADTANHRVAVFDSGTGVFKRAFADDVGGTNVGTCTTTCAAGTAGDDANQLDTPVGLAAANGRVYVADSADNRVTSFTAAGAPVRGYGKDVGGSGTTTCTGLCQIGTAGSAAGQLDEVTGVAVDGGRVFVSERYNNRVSVFDEATGAFQRAFGRDVGGAGLGTCTSSCHAGTASDASGALDQPSGVAAAAGEVFVSDARNRRVAVFDGATGVFKRAFGEDVGGPGAHTCTSACGGGRPGPAGGRLDVPVAIAVAGGNVFLTESINNRVSVFDATTGAFLRAVGGSVGGFGIDTCESSCRAAVPGPLSGQLSNPRGVAVAVGSVFVADTDNNRLAAFAVDPVTAPPAGRSAAAAVSAAPEGGGGAARTVAAPKPPAAAKPRATIRVTSLATALRRGVLVKLTGLKPGRVALVARHRKVRVASGAGAVRADGTAAVRIRFTTAGRRGLRRARGPKLTVSGGGATATITLRGRS
jgi:hypothetical protein